MIGMTKYRGKNRFAHACRHDDTIQIDSNSLCFEDSDPPQ